tara:strand:- start:737 stop:1018 length:282 start_codon:yes stop_codon:yes gene_type:complete
MPNYKPYTIQFNNTSSGDNLTYLWDFGDGSTSTEAEPQHTFDDGVFTITLTIGNQNGTATTSAQIIVEEPDTSFEDLDNEDTPSGKSSPKLKM